jgi:hypothetical protein
VRSRGGVSRVPISDNLQCASITSQHKYQKIHLRVSEQNKK